MNPDNWNVIVMQRKRGNQMVISNTTTANAILNSPRNIGTWLQRAWRFNPMLVLLVAANLVLLAVGLIGLAADPRTVLNAPVWAKTTKFSISIILYGGTLLWILSHIKSRPRAAQFVANGTGAILLLEMGLIVLQAVRGVPMHFNQATPFDTVVWRTMSVTISIFFMIDLIGAIVLLREKMADRVLAWSLRLGLLVALLGMVLAFTMSVPTAPQMAALQTGQTIDMMGAHNVGAMVDGQTRMLPFLGWNMDGGDLRIAHFIGLHGLQVIPLLGWLLSRRATGLREGQRLALVGVGAAGYTGLVGVLFWQALRNQSIIAPDALTLLALVGLVAGVAVAGTLVVRVGRRAQAA